MQTFVSRWFVMAGRFFTLLGLALALSAVAPACESPNAPRFPEEEEEEDPENPGDEDEG